MFQNAQSLSTGVIKNERWGTSIFAHAPIMGNTAEKVIGVVSTGFAIATLEKTMQPIFFLISGLFLLIVILVSLSICILLRSRKRSLEVEYLTQLGTKHFFENQLARVSYRAKASKTPFSLLLLDVDGFKQINDSYGHLTGDRVLQTVATILRSQVQASDICSRIGGDEFAVILASSPLKKALATKESIQNMIRDYSAEDIPELELSISIGVAQWDGSQSMPELFEQTDQDLYKAKKRKDSVVTD